MQDGWTTREICESREDREDRATQLLIWELLSLAICGQYVDSPENTAVKLPFPPYMESFPGGIF